MPAKPNKELLDKLHGEIVRIIHAPDYKQRQLEVATDIVGSSPEALASRQKTDIEKYRKLAQTAGITPE
jgi:tripartite-type tricarboxylate transporter receptor subunit TctC